MIREISLILAFTLLAPPQAFALRGEQQPESKAGLEELNKALVGSEAPSRHKGTSTPRTPVFEQMEVRDLLSSFAGILMPDQGTPDASALVAPTSVSVEGETLEPALTEAVESLMADAEGEAPSGVEFSGTPEVFTGPGLTTRWTLNNKTQSVVEVYLLTVMTEEKTGGASYESYQAGVILQPGLNTVEVTVPEKDRAGLALGRYTVSTIVFTADDRRIAEVHGIPWINGTIDLKLGRSEVPAAVEAGKPLVVQLPVGNDGNAPDVVTPIVSLRNPRDPRGTIRELQVPGPNPRFLVPPGGTTLTVVLPASLLESNQITVGPWSVTPTLLDGVEHQVGWYRGATVLFGLPRADYDHLQFDPVVTDSHYAVGADNLRDPANPNHIIGYEVTVLDTFTAKPVDTFTVGANMDADFDSRGERHLVYAQFGPAPTSPQILLQLSESTLPAHTQPHSIRRANVLLVDPSRPQPAEGAYPGYTIVDFISSARTQDQPDDSVPGGYVSQVRFVPNTNTVEVVTSGRVISSSGIGREPATVQNYFRDTGAQTSLQVTTESSQNIYFLGVPEDQLNPAIVRRDYGPHGEQTSCTAQVPNQPRQVEVDYSETPEPDAQVARFYEVTVRQPGAADPIRRLQVEVSAAKPGPFGRTIRPQIGPFDVVVRDEQGNVLHTQHVPQGFFVYDNVGVNSVELESPVRFSADGRSGVLRLTTARKLDERAAIVIGFDPVTGAILGIRDTTLLPYDVNGDGHVTPLDALQVINFLNVQIFSGNIEVPADKLRLDVNGDLYVSPVGDVLPIISHLNDINFTVSGIPTGNPEDPNISVFQAARQGDIYSLSASVGPGVQRKQVNVYSYNSSGKAITVDLISTAAPSNPKTYAQLAQPTEYHRELMNARRDAQRFYDELGNPALPDSHELDPSQPTNAEKQVQVLKIIQALDQAITDYESRTISTAVSMSVVATLYDPEGEESSLTFQHFPRNAEAGYLRRDDTTVVNFSTGRIDRIVRTLREEGQPEEITRQTVKPGDSDYRETLQQLITQVNSYKDAEAGPGSVERRARIDAFQQRLEDLQAWTDEVIDALDQAIAETEPQAEGEAAPAAVAPEVVDAVAAAAAPAVSWEESVDAVMQQMEALQPAMASEIAEKWNRVEAPAAQQDVKPVVPIFYNPQTFHAVPLVARSGMPFVVVAESTQQEGAVRDILSRMENLDPSRYTVVRSDLEGTSVEAAVQQAEQRFTSEGFTPYRVNPARPAWLNELMSYMAELGTLPRDERLPFFLQETELYFGANA